MPGRMIKIREGDPRITVDGKPLEDVLEEEQRKELENDLGHARKQEIGAKTLTKKQFRPRERYEEDPRRVKRRVRRLSEYEIRKEYGVKVKPFPSLTKNVFYVLFHAGDQKIGSKAIADELDKPLPDVSSSLSNIYNKMKNDNLIKRERAGLAFHYTLTPEALERGFETIYRTYFPGQGSVSRRPPGERTGLYAEIELPFKRASRNAIYILCQDPGRPIKTATISEGLGKPVQNMSSTLKKIWDRLEAVDLLTKTGPANRLSYIIDPLATVGGAKPLIEFLYSHHDHWQKGKEFAQEYFKAYVPQPTTEEPLRGAAPEAPPPIAAPSDAAVKPTGPTADKVVPIQLPAQIEEALSNLTQKFDEIESRIIRMEDDGVEKTAMLKKVQGIDNQLQNLQNHITDVMANKIVDEVSGTAPTNEFTINLRFLFGRAG